LPAGRRSLSSGTPNVEGSPARIGDAVDREEQVECALRHSEARLAGGAEDITYEVACLPGALHLFDDEGIAVVEGGNGAALHELGDA
jgi:hypothetical protein